MASAAKENQAKEDRMALPTRAVQGGGPGRSEA